MTERPILFSGPMVRALLAGTKTQTRRIVKPQPVVPDGASIRLYDQSAAHMTAQRCWQVEHPGDYDGHNVIGCREDDGRQLNVGRMPFCVSDRLIVRENGWERPERTPKMLREGADTWAPYYYDADGISLQEAADFKAWGFKRRPSIHMPRKHCRLMLEVTGVRVERLQSISEADCRAEGCAGGHGSIPGYAYSATPCEHYMHIWASLNGGAASWAANPWVWVVEFRTVEPGAAKATGTHAPRGAHASSAGGI